MMKGKEKLGKERSLQGEMAKFPPIAELYWEEISVEGAGSRRESEPIYSTII